MSLQTPPRSLPDCDSLPELPTMYSQELRDLVLKCYHIDQLARPTAIDILDTCIRRGYWNETLVSPYGTLVSSNFHSNLQQSWNDCLRQLNISNSSRIPVGQNEIQGSPQASHSALTGMSSWPRSPSIDTDSAVAVMAFQASAHGGSGFASATATTSPTVSPMNIMRCSRCRSGLNHTDSTAAGYSGTVKPRIPGLSKVLTRRDGLRREEVAISSHIKSNKRDIRPFWESGSDTVDYDKIAMDLTIRTESILPTFEGFEADIHKLHPRIPGILRDRIAEEQMRRFERLMDSKTKHLQALDRGRCPAENFCTVLGDGPKYLPDFYSPKPISTSGSTPGLSTSNHPTSDDEVKALAEGIVTPCMLPPGVPMPPAERLPASFECAFCFKVKKYTKPSDWAKHVHEDLRPFTCTWPSCPEPQSFKRKADWVKHENERHWQSSWWTCTMSDCTYSCFWKDEFVRHLVCKHKLPEPPKSERLRSQRTGIEIVGPVLDRGSEPVWKLLDECRHEKNPRNQACIFCGNNCNSWKKFTVHVAQHLEQISMPVLGLVSQQLIKP